MQLLNGQECKYYTILVLVVIVNFSRKWRIWSESRKGATVVINQSNRNRACPRAHLTWTRTNQNLPLQLAWLFFFSFFPFYTYFPHWIFQWNKVLCHFIHISYPHFCSYDSGNSTSIYQEIIVCVQSVLR